jgi:L-cysteine:1D-myo-inositol 2-amino-2-deoxy-alpha-D-glucopyranoside ligase
MAIRLAVLAHHYRSDWEWTDAVLDEAQARLARWRSVFGDAAVSGGAADSGGAAVSAAEVLAAVRDRLADDLDTPGALAAIDGWVAAAARPTPADAALVRNAADALLGIAL